MKILLSAFACYPGYGSEPGIGWQLARHLARDHEVWVLTDERNAPGIRPALEESSSRMPEVRFVDLGIGYSFAHRLYYLVWQVRAYFHARTLQRRVDFDLIHHVTYVTSWPPSFMGWLDVPFVWSTGPKERTPAAFLRHMSLKGAAT
ncbi:MAG: glycosyltransferase, partial [Anaerolineales bacterium]